MTVSLVLTETQGNTCAHFATRVARPVLLIEKAEVRAMAVQGDRSEGFPESTAETVRMKTDSVELINRQWVRVPSHEKRRETLRACREAP